MNFANCAAKILSQVNRVLVTSFSRSNSGFMLTRKFISGWITVTFAATEEKRFEKRPIYACLGDKRAGISS